MNCSLAALIIHESYGGRCNAVNKKHRQGWYMRDSGHAANKRQIFDDPAILKQEAQRRCGRLSESAAE